MRTLITPPRFVLESLPMSAMPSMGLWLDGDDASTFTYSSGSVVSQWSDKSPVARHGTQGTVAQQPVRDVTINGLSAVRFDGADWLTLASAITVVPCTMLAVVHVPAATGGYFIGGDTASFAWGILAADQKQTTARIGTLSFPSSDTSIGTSPAVIAVSVTQAERGYYLGARGDGGHVDARTFNGMTQVGRANSAGSSVLPFTGYLGEIGVSTSLLDSSVIMRLALGLVEKWL